MPGTHLRSSSSEELLIMPTHWRLQRLVLHVTTNFDESLSLAMAARICGLEKTYFCRFFQAQTGLKFSEWFRQVRIDRAKRLLLEHRCIADVAAAVGYRDVSTFERHFRKCEKLSPIQYRKRQRTNSEILKTTTTADKSTMFAELSTDDPR